MRRHLRLISAIAGIILSVTAIAVNWTRIDTFFFPPGCEVTIRLLGETSCVEFVVLNKHPSKTCMLTTATFSVMEYEAVPGVHSLRELEHTLLSADYTLRIVPEELATIGWETSLPIRQEIPAEDSDAFAVCIELDGGGPIIRPLSSVEDTLKAKLRITLFDAAGKKVAKQEVYIDFGQYTGSLKAHRIIAL